MNYRAFFNNPNRRWWKESPGVYNARGYVLSLDDDPRHGRIWNLYKFDREAPDCYTCIAHNIPNDAIPLDTLTERK